MSRPFRAKACWHRRKGYSRLCRTPCIDDDQFYELSGEFVFSNDRGLVQTFVDLGGSEVARGSTEQVHINSGVDPTRGTESNTVERTFPVAQSGWQLPLLLTSVFVLAVRLWETR